MSTSWQGACVRQPREIVDRDLLRNLAKAVPVGLAGSVAGPECPQQTGIFDPARG
jgi:hypothetical protein